MAFIEEHAYPEPDWAEALINAHRQAWAAVGPVVENANPKGRISWADFIISYGPWMESSPTGVVGILPGHNSSYKKAILNQYGDQLEDYLEAENVLHTDLGKKGYQLYLEPEARVRHLNFTRFSTWLPSQYYTGRLFAAIRSMSWSPFQRLVFTAGSPLIPIVRLCRILPQMKGLRKRHSLPGGILIFVLLGLGAGAAGEMLGYALGAGTSKQRNVEWEFHRTSK